MDKGTAGVDVNKIHDKMGIRPAITGEVAFSDVKVPENNLVGGLNRDLASGSV